MSTPTSFLAPRDRRVPGSLLPGRPRLLCAALLVALPLAAVGGGLRAQLPQDLAPLALALLRLEYALKDRPPEPAMLAQVSRGFDQATLAFFAGRTEEVLRILDSLVAVVEPEEGVRARQEEKARSVLAGLSEKGRILEGVSPPIPYRLVGPSRPGSDPLPVIVALHGAGGNEHMFVEAYGAGRLAELAEEKGFVVISPSTTALARSPGALRELLDAAAAAYPLDRGRVGVVGHSMGAAAAWQLAETFGRELAGVVCLAGPCPGRPPQGGGRSAEELPPLLVVAGETDPLAPPSRLEEAATQGRNRGLEVEMRVVPGLGHTLMVGAVLDEVVAWLLARPGR